MRSARLISIFVFILASQLVSTNIALGATDDSPTLTLNTNHAATKIVFAPGGRWFATSGLDRTVKIWDLKTGHLLRDLRGHSKSIESIAISPDARYLASIDVDGNAKVWNPENGQLVGESKRGPYSDIVFSRDGRDLIALSSNSEVIRWEPVSGTVRKTYQIKNAKRIRHLAISPDGNTLAAGDADKGLVFLLDLESGRQRQWSAQQSNVGFVKFSPDGQRLATTSGAADDVQPVKVWDVRTGGIIAKLAGHRKYLEAITFSADSTSIYASSVDEHVVRAWNIATAKQSWASEAPNSTWDLAVTFSGEIVSVGDAVSFWEGSTGRELKRLSRPSSSRYGDAVAVLPDGNWLLAGPAGFGIWDAKTGQRQQLFGTPAGNYMQSVVDTGDRWLVSTILDLDVKVWDVKAGRELASIRKKNAFLYPSFLSADGSVVRVIDDGKGSYAEYESTSGKFKRTVQAYPNTIRLLGGSHDGARILTAGTNSDNSNAIKIWDGTNGRLLKTIEVVGPEQFFVQDAHFAWVSWYKTLGLIDLDAGRIVRQIDTGMPYQKCALSRDAASISCAGGGSLREWQTSDGRDYLRADSADIDRLAYSADGKFLLGTQGNGTLRVLSSATGELLTTSVQSDQGEWITITPEGFFAASEHGAELLSVVRGFDAVGIDQLFQSLYRPDLVREKLLNDPRGLVQQAAANIDLRKAVVSGAAPDVRLTLPGRALASGAVAAGDGVVVDAEITDRGGGIGRVEWRINGVTTGAETPVANGNQPVRLSRRFAPDVGDNVIDLTAYNSANLVASTPARLNLTGQPAASPAPQPSSPEILPAPVISARPKLFALVAGVNAYADRRFRLSYALSDAQEIARAFKEASGDLYQSVTVKLMTDGEVTREKLDVAFSEMSAQATASDVFVLYIAGHGKTIDGRYYFAPQDFAVDGELSEAAINTAVKQRGIDQDQWQRWFAAIPARKSVILFDTCESGTLLGDETQQLENGAANDRLAQATGRSILTASSGREEALEGYKGHGLFTYAALDAINQADSDRNGTIEINELAAYVYAAVNELSERVFKQRQVPQVKVTASYALTRKTRILAVDEPAIAGAATNYQLSKAAQLQVQPRPGTVVRSLSAKTPVTLLESKDGWSLVASEGKPIGYVATRDLAPLP